MVMVWSMRRVCTCMYNDAPSGMKTTFFSCGGVHALLVLRTGHCGPNAHTVHGRGQLVIILFPRELSISSDREIGYREGQQENLGESEVKEQHQIHERAEEKGTSS